MEQMNRASNLIGFVKVGWRTWKIGGLVRQDDNVLPCLHCFFLRVHRATEIVGQGYPRRYLQCDQHSKEEMNEVIQHSN